MYVTSSNLLMPLMADYMPNSHRNDFTDEKWFIKIEKGLFMKSISPGSQDKKVSEPGSECALDS